MTQATVGTESRTIAAKPVVLAPGEDALLVACPKSHPFASRRSIVAEELTGQPLMLLEDGHCLRNHALTACRLLPGQANEDLQATSLSTLVQMVGGGLGLTLVPRLAVDVETRREPNIAVLPLADRPPTREIALVWRSESARSRDLTLLGEMLRAGMAPEHVPTTEPDLSMTSR